MVMDYKSGEGKETGSELLFLTGPINHDCPESQRTRLHKDTGTVKHKSLVSSWPLVSMVTTKA